MPCSEKRRQILQLTVESTPRVPLAASSIQKPNSRLMPSRPRQHEGRSADARDHDLQIRVERLRAHQAIFDRRAEPHRDDQRDGDPQQPRDQRQQRHMRITDAKAHAVHPRDHGVLNAQQREYHADPNDYRHDLLDEKQPRMLATFAVEHPPKKNTM
ncbi:hypothetical protein OKW35_006293 [Paraburkholderia sp. MM5477-R1]